MTASQDSTVRLWDTETGECTQVLANHSDEVFSSLFSYDGEAVITASKDNCINIWKNTLSGSL
jgi:dynein assembly factor with WDR repeat domains 1